MNNPHLEPLIIENRFEGKHVRIYLAASRTTNEYSLHIKLNGDRGLHESETLRRILELDECAECPLNGGGLCHWKPLGRKETVDAAAVIDASFDRFRRHLDLALERIWDYRCALRDLGYPDPLEFLAGLAE